MLKINGVKTNVPLAPYTTYKIGGPADYFVIVSTKDDLIGAVTEARKENIPFFLLGTGANILMSDLGFRGLVIKNEANKFIFDQNTLTTESGATIAELIEACIRENLSGLEHFVGIPSSVGGALWQNLHFLNPERNDTLYLGEILESAEILDEDNTLKLVNRNFFNFDYDYSILHDKKCLVTEASFKLNPKISQEIRKQMVENMKWRNEKQPQLSEFPSCGSVFKKIEGVGAGRLIDQSGLKGYQIGDIRISEKHANYFVNMGGGKADDVLALIKHTQKVVKAKTGYNLEPEISFVGEFK